MDYNIQEVAQRLKGLREALNLSEEYMCSKAKLSLADYRQIENGEKDFSVSFIFICAEILGVDLIELLTGDRPKLSKYSIVRKGKGLPIERRERFAYQHLAYLFQDKQIEPLLVVAPFEEQAQDQPIALSAHDGQEFDYVLEGTLKCVFGGKTELLTAGDAVYYDSSMPHGMIAVKGADCKFMAILIKK